MSDHPSTDEAREAAAGLVAEIRERHPALLELLGIDLGAALEQQLFFALRGTAPAPASSWALDAARTLARLAGAGGAATLATRRRTWTGAGTGAGAPRVAALVRAVSHLPILDHVDTALAQLGAGPIIRVRVGAAAAARRRRAAPHDLDLADLLSPRHLPAVAAHHAAVMRQADPAAGLPAGLDRVVRRELPRIGLGAWGLASLVERLAPALLVCFDEKGTWARLLPAAARRHGIPSLDLPHSETSEPAAIAGAGYDAMAVFGQGGRELLLRAGIDPSRIVETGAPHFDPLITAPPSRAAADDPRPCILLASQYVTGAMTADLLAAVFRGAAAAAGELRPSQLVVRPHPAEMRGAAAAALRATPIPEGVEVRLESERGLHGLLDDAWLLVTGWSNSVFEAALRRVPALMVVPGGVVPVPYAAERMALLATDEEGAAAAARSLRDPAIRRAAVEAARSGLERHLGPLDGRAARRTAELVLSMASRRGA